MRVLQYQQSPIAYAKSLAHTLGCRESDIHCVVRHREQLYLQHERPKKSGGVRVVYVVREPLKAIQGAILDQILHQTSGPSYLFGAFRDPTGEHTYIANAEFHTGAIVLVKLDVRDYFGSIRTSLVFNLWKHEFGFHPDVARLLTDLTTYHESLPQGAATSPLIAAMVLCTSETALIEGLAADGFRYSRYIDDITLSATEFVEPKRIESAIARVIGMLQSNGLKINRGKTEILVPSMPMHIHGVNINSGHPSLGRAKKRIVRAAVNRCEAWDEGNRESEEYSKQYSAAQRRL